MRTPMGLITVIALGSLAGAAYGERPLQEPKVVCAAHMKAIGRALVRYQEEKGRLPDRLAELYTGFLTDKALLHCPADTSNGSNGFTAFDEDRLPASYLYEMSGNPDSSGSQLLGPPPDKRDPTWRDTKIAQRRWFGDRVPAVRCLHHGDTILNLTLKGKLYESGMAWEMDPSTLPDVIACMVRDLEAGGKRFADGWLPAPVGEYFRRLRDTKGAVPDAMRLKIRATGARIARAEGGTPAKDAGLAFMAGSLYYTAGDLISAMTAFERAALGESETVLGKSVGKLETVFVQSGRADKRVRFFERLVEAYPKEPAFMRKLADAYEAVGKRDKATEWRTRADAIAPIRTTAP